MMPWQRARQPGVGQLADARREDRWRAVRVSTARADVSLEPRHHPWLTLGISTASRSGEAGDVLPAPTNDDHAPHRSYATNGTITELPVTWRFVVNEACDEPYGGSYVVAPVTLE